MKPWSQDGLTAYPSFCSRKRLEVFLLPGWDASQSQVTSPPLVRFPLTICRPCLYTWVERGTVRVKCLAKEHNTMPPARARTQTTRSRVKHTNHEAIVPTLDGTPSLELPTCADGWALQPHTSSEYATWQLYNLKVYRNLPGMHACNDIHSTAHHFQRFLYTGFILFEDFKIP